jgi:quinol monooxygenase YgiN
MSEFVQIMRFKTDQVDQLAKMNAQYRADTAGRSTLTSEVVGQDLDSGEYVVIVTFPSREAADANNALPETQALAEQTAALCDGPISFSNVEVRDI